MNDVPNDKLFDDSPIAPGEVIRQMLEERGWTQDDLAIITLRSRSQINDVICGRAEITREMALALAGAFKNQPAYWINLDALYRLPRSSEDREVVARRAAVFDVAPIKEMQRRGWITQTKDIEQIQKELEKFFGVNSLADLINHSFAMRKTDAMTELTSAQRAWVYKVRQMAKAQLVAEFKPEALPKFEQQLKRLAVNPEEVYKVPKLLASFGIRFVVVEPIQSCRVDGVALWLDQSSPVIGMSLRYDRVDSFWFTLGHEYSHIKNRDDSPLDSDLTEQPEMVVKSAMERRADEEAASTLIPQEEMVSFIRRVGPLYSKDRIIRFANRIRIHPGIVVGQLQHRKEIGYSALRDYLSKIRQYLIPAAIVDGWGQIIDPRSFL